MARPRTNVVIGILGSQKDAISGAHRFEKWRPTISICQQSHFRADRFELLYEPKYAELAERVAADLREVSPGTAVQTHPIDVGPDPWDFENVFDALIAFARGYSFDPEEEDYYIHITTGTHVEQICLFLLTESRFLPGRLLQSFPDAKRADRGKPGGITVIDLDLSRFDRIATRLAQDHSEARDFLKSGIATKNRSFNALIDRIETVALRTGDPILLTGPTGAGKSQLARRICELKQQRAGMTGKFVEVNCAILRGDAALSALFGHVKGAFTGAVSDRAGLLREADKGLIFLDEIGELGLEEQAMLLRAVEEKVFHPHGSDRTVKSDFQLIAGTNRDLAADVREGKFREDLFARINLWTFTLPGLAERREDISPNLDFELERASRRLGRKITMNRESREAFLRFARDPASAWRANFRDLNAAVTRLATLAERGRISEDLVTEEVQRLRHAWDSMTTRSAPAAADEEVLASVLTPDALADVDPFDRVQLALVIRTCRRTKTLSDAGRELFSASRRKKANPNDADRLRKYLARFGLEWKSVQE